MYQRIDQLHDQNYLLKKQLEATKQVNETMESDLTFQRQQSAVLSSMVRDHEQRWITSLQRMVTVHPSGENYHTSSNCRWYRGGKSFTLCTYCKRHSMDGHEGSMSEST